MEAKVVKENPVLLKLSQAEANWLQGVMQNPLHGETPDLEDLSQAAYRRELFEALRGRRE